MADQHPINGEETWIDHQDSRLFKLGGVSQVPDMIDKSSDRLRHHFDLLDGDPPARGDLVFPLHLRFEAFYGGPGANAD
ncbi:MAG: hypothetical protein IPG25_15685 [Proteobacteria bacterium]|nr:hypothetical protein [Pseudomonadota bacterium]